MILERLAQVYAGVEGAGGVRAAYAALGRAPCIVITQSQAVGGEDRLPDC